MTVGKFFRNIILYFFVAAYGIQIALGIVWLCVQTYKTRDVTVLFQCALLYIAVAYVLSRYIRSIKRCAFGAAAVVTMPLVMNSLIPGDTRISIAIAALICYVIYRKNKKIALLVVILGILAAGIGMMTIREKETKWDLFSRIAYTHIEEYVAMTYGDEDYETDHIVASFVTFDSKNLYADEVIPKFCIELEAMFGEEVMQDVYGTLMATALESNKDRVIAEIIWDAAGYAIAPPVALRQLDNAGSISLTHRNYDRFRRNSPILSKYYYTYGIYIFCICFVLAVMLYIYGIVGKKFSVPSFLSIVIYILLAGTCIGVLTLRGGGLMDYTLALPILLSELIMITGIDLNEKL